jgi:hypothetical protein
MGETGAQSALTNRLVRNFMNGAVGSVVSPPEHLLGRISDPGKMPAHWLLAQMGKRVLRPGGMELTRRMLDALAIDSADDVVEFAPGLGATAKLTLQRGPASYVAIERDEAAANHVRKLLNGLRQRCAVGNAQATGLAPQSASVVYGEAMLTMQPAATKDQIVGEAARLLRPKGRYGIHELALVPDDLPDPQRVEIARVFGGTIHHLVQPLTAAEWRDLFERHGLDVQTTLHAPMHLLEPVRLMRDEGPLRAARFVLNVLCHREARKRVLELRKLFRGYRDNVTAIALIGIKR